MKKLTLLFVGIFMLFGAINAQTKLYLDLRSFSTWAEGGAKFQAWTWQPSQWSSAFTLVTGETQVYEITVPNGTSSAIIYRRSPSHSMNQHDDNYWEKSGDLNLGSNNCVKVTGWGAYSITNYTPVTTPTVQLTIPSMSYVDEQIVFSATSLNVASPVYVYSVKAPGSGSFAMVSSPYQPQATGTYTFKVEVAAGSNPSAVLATDEKEVVVKTVPDPITVKMRIENNYLSDGSQTITWTNVKFYAWNAEIAEVFYTPTQNGEWYSYTFERMELVNIIFVNGTNWSHTPYQSKDVLNIIESTCFEVQGIDFAGDWKRTVAKVECPPPPSVSLTIPSKSFINEQIVFSATSTNVASPVYTYYVKVPETDTYAAATSPYQPAIIGIHSFKVEVAESAFPTNILATNTADVAVKDVTTKLEQIGKPDYAVKTGVAAIRIEFEGSAAIELYNINGTLLKKTVAVDSFEQTALTPGLYVLKINGKVNKVLVK